MNILAIKQMVSVIQEFRDLIADLYHIKSQYYSFYIREMSIENDKINIEGEIEDNYFNISIPFMFLEQDDWKSLFKVYYREQESKAIQKLNHEKYIKNLSETLQSIESEICEIEEVIKNEHISNKLETLKKMKHETQILLEKAKNT